MISKKLYTFLKEWLDWAEDGAPIHEVFSRHLGLCSCYSNWSAEYQGSFMGSDELDKIFEGDEFPFGKDNYSNRYHDDTQHLCPKRLAWVKQQIKKYEENNND